MVCLLVQARLAPPTRHARGLNSGGWNPHLLVCHSPSACTGAAQEPEEEEAGAVQATLHQIRARLQQLLQQGQHARVVITNYSENGAAVRAALCQDDGLPQQCECVSEHAISGRGGGVTVKLAQLLAAADGTRNPES